MLHDRIGLATQTPPAVPERRFRPWPGVVPVLVSVGLVTWLVWRVSPRALALAAAQLNWWLLAPATLALVLALYFWESVCLRWLFWRPDYPLSYPAVLRARGTSYLAGVFNYELGQGLVAWLLARATGMGLLSGLGRCATQAVHDVAILLTLGFIGSVGVADLPAPGLRIWTGAGLCLALGLMLLPTVLPRAWSGTCQRSRWGACLGWWTWRDSLTLYALRGAYFAIFMLYAAVGLSCCGVPVTRAVLLGVIPLVLLADGLPLSISGLGTRETALVLLLGKDRPEILAWSLLWSGGLLVGRGVIGLGHLWLSRSPGGGDQG